MLFSLSVPKWDMWIGVFGGGGKWRGRVRILRTAAGDSGGGTVRRMRTLHATHRRITDAWAPNAGPVAHCGRARLGC